MRGTPGIVTERFMVMAVGMLVQLLLRSNRATVMPFAKRHQYG